MLYGDNLYTTGFTNSSGAGGVDFFTSKYDAKGMVQWKKTLGASGATDQGNGIAISSSQDLYVVGFTSTNYIQVAKYNSSGAVQWQKRSLAATGNFQKTVVGPSGYIYICGSYTNATTTFTNNACLVKIDSSGLIQWNRLLGWGASASFERFFGIALDSSENVYLAGYTNNGNAATANRSILVKYNSSGTIQWQRGLIINSLSTVSFGIATTPSGDSYVVGGFGGAATGVGGATSIFLAKYDTNGNFGWKAVLNNTSLDGGVGVALDGSGNIYITGATSVSGGDKDLFIAKYNSSGSLQWQRTFNGAGGEDIGTGIIVDAAGNMYISASLSFATPYGYSGLIKLPTDGSRTGIYGVVWRYDPASLVSIAYTHAVTTTPLVDTAGPLTTLANSTHIAADAPSITPILIPL